MRVLPQNSLSPASQEPEQFFPLLCLDVTRECNKIAPTATSTQQTKKWTMS